MEEQAELQAKKEATLERADSEESSLQMTLRDQIQEQQVLKLPFLLITESGLAVEFVNS